MNEQEQDIFCNQCIMNAAGKNVEAEASLKENRLSDCIRNNYETVFSAMKGILAADGLFPPDDPGIERLFLQRYFDNGLVSEELGEILQRLDEAYDDIQRDASTEVSRPECGYFTAKSKRFLEEIEDLLVAKNARYMGQ